MTLLGATVSQSTAVNSYPQEYDRGAGDYCVENAEAQIRLDGGDPGYHYGAAPRTYTFMGNSFPPANENSRPGRDADVGRMSFVGWKASGGLTWDDYGNGNPTANAQITARGNELAQYLSDHPFQNIAVTWHHEPNGDEAVAGTSGTTVASTGRSIWRSALQNIWEIWTQDCDVPIWSGDQNGNTDSYGAILAGPNIADGAYALTNSTQTMNDWYPSSWTWGWDNLQMACIDAYVSGPNAGEQFRAFEEVMGALAARPGFYLWVQDKIATQNGAGKVLLPSIWETGVQERNQVNSNGAKYSQTSTYWTNTYGNPVTRAAWIEHMGEWVTDNWPGLHSLIYWDFMTSANINPWMVDTTQAAWDAWVALTAIDQFSGNVVEPPPEPSDFTPGAIGVAQRVRMVSQ